MSYQSESQLENQMIEQLANQGFTFIHIANEDDLKGNLRKQINDLNNDNLLGTPLSDKEFERVLLHLEGKSVYESAKILRDKFVLIRDDNSKVYLEFFDSKDVTRNVYQVTNQITMVGKYRNRYDVTILVNGLPLVQFELKRRGVAISEAFNQIERYRKHSYTGLFRYIQIFIITNGVDTKYFANSDKGLLFSKTFFWTDRENKRITTLREFVYSFVNINHLHKMLAKYFVINDTDKSLIVMRPYQVYAVEAIVKRATESANNGFVWHTTGSGKTLTSFKASQILSMIPEIEKVIFLVDRKDLDMQTISEFNKFEENCVDATEKTDNLVDQIKDPTRKLIVTTIQKLSNAVNSSNYSDIMRQVANKKVVFMCDECHRSQFGKMHLAINKHFNYAQFFGFTGTPIFVDNQSSDGRVTADLFGDCLHKYLIKDAISDGNVLGFSVEYVKTFKVDPESKKNISSRGIDKKEIYMNDERIELITKHVLKYHHHKTRNCEYTSIFTVESIPMLMKYYDHFKAYNHDLRIAAIFTYGTNEDVDGNDEHSRESLERVIQDYNVMFDCNYSTDSFSSYFTDVAKKVKTGQVDILLVVNMFLTGFDSSTLNTLYVDRNLSYHGLLQAYSRTNRIERATKPQGNIVCFRDLKENTDNTMKLFSKCDNTDTVLLQNYEYYLELFKNKLNSLHKMVSKPSDVDSLQSEEAKKKFILAFRELTKVLIRLQTFINFKFDEDTIGIDEQTYQDFKSKYLLIYDEVKKGEEGPTSILGSIDFGIEIMHTDKINVDYIMNLLRNIDYDNEEKKNQDINFILQQLDSSDNERLRIRSKIIKLFLSTIVPELSSEDCIDDIYYKFQKNQKEKEVKEFSDLIEVEKQFLEDQIAEYEYSGILNHQQISNHLKGDLLVRRRLRSQIQKFIEEIAIKFD